MARYISTRNKDIEVNDSQAIINGLAPDGGLYMMKSIDNEIDLKDLISMNYQEIASLIISKVFDDFSYEEIEEIVYKAYDSKFDDELIAPIKQINNDYLLELWHGPTSAFKDIALTLLPHLLTLAYKKSSNENKIVILTATSGDTGKAAIEGFSNVDNTSIIVLYPDLGVSLIQKRQMQTSKASNVQVISINGNFDDCQRIVKEAYTDANLLKDIDNITLSSANSINIGRLIPQVVYYFSSYINLVQNKEIKLGDKINYVVPTGNFGDILAGYLAKKMGLPVNKLICASNDNHILTDFLNTGIYDTNRDFHLTMSPSMDILISSNLERLLFLASDNNTVLVNSLMKDLKEKGKYSISNDLLIAIQKDFASYYATEKDCCNTIKETFESTSILIDPHTSVAVSCLNKYRNDTSDNTKAIILSTASAYKFAKNVYKAISNIELEDEFLAMKKLNILTNTKIPDNLNNLKDKEIRFNEVIDKEKCQSYLRKKLEEISYASD